MARGIVIQGNRLTVEHEGSEVTVELKADDRGRLIPVKVTVAADGGVRADVLRTVPLQAIEAAANSGIGEILLAANTAEQSSEPVPVWSRRPALNLRAPAGRGRKSDEFYKRVAAAYSWLSANQSRPGPANVLAKRNDVPISTVHRWVKTARARGFLAPGQRGRAS